MPPDALAIHPLTADRWPDLEDLFGPQRGANSGCWCMWPRVAGVAFKAMDREDRKHAFHAIVAAGPPPGLLAYDGDRAVGWCAVGPRVSLARFQSAKTSRLVDEPGGPEMSPIYVISCFFIRTGYRKRGLTSRLATEAIEFLLHRAAEAADLGRGLRRHRLGIRVARLPGERSPLATPAPDAAHPRPAMRG